ncbi:hypothetical protein SBI_05696 [Streptomyces bingchenggensis BCW-1]|uniref:Uncharacterized protein n=2 Tax=Streptomyces TaxID=1883 RepID=D7CCT5_STRBB|nr:hypothetical protein [Streptomyces milbemycinicus]ADI08816.1 hypothetical protein SBI_05696 [Streptomyces bingchenggensis BCW-1]
MSVGELVRAELARHEWAALRCGCGESAEHVPLMFEAILTAGTPQDMIEYTLDNHLEIGPWDGRVWARSAGPGPARATG